MTPPTTADERGSGIEVPKCACRIWLPDFIGSRCAECRRVIKALRGGGF